MAENTKETPDFSLIVFGASGSLASLKIFPALYELFHKARMPRAFQIIGFGRTPMTDLAFRASVRASVQKSINFADLRKLDLFSDRFFYCSGQYGRQQDFENLRGRLEGLEQERQAVRLAYCSVPPSAFADVFRNLSVTAIDAPASPLRLIIEKPVGSDLKSAMELERTLREKFRPEQVFLLDHYLGKEAVTNLLAMRYANTMIAALTNQAYVRNVQISALESKDIEGRSGYFDPVGILRDMIQSHMLQILSALAMPLPQEPTFEEIRAGKIALLESIHMESLSGSVVRGQYKGYQNEKGVPPGSQTETFSALKLFVENPAWKGIPIYIRSGKALAQPWTAVVVEFKPHCAECGRRYPPNRIVFEIQPDQRLSFHLLTKQGGKFFDFQSLTTGHSFYCTGDCLSEYGRLILEALEGRKDLFLDFREVLAGWRVVDPIQEICNRLRNSRCGLESYAKGTWGPESADRLIEKDGFAWFNPGHVEG